MVIIVTATIAPESNMQQLVLKDKEQRLRQYKSALNSLIDAKPDAKIVFCDNSGFGTDGFEEEIACAKKQGIQLEILSFLGDSDAVIRHGKGYGEGEIIRHVLSESKLICDERYMMKITGRLRVDNIANLVSKVNQNRVYFNIPNIHRKDLFDTRVYAMPVKTYREYFETAYKKVDDDQGYYLEHAFTDAIFENSLKVCNFPCYPRIVGESGSGGAQYTYTEWKSKVRDILSVFNVYGQVRKG